MNTTEGNSSLILAISHLRNSGGTSSTMSHRNPSTPFEAQKRTMRYIASQVPGAL